MIEQFPYPDAEYYAEPTNPTELLADELRIYKDSYSIRLGLEGLKNMYCRAPIFDALAQISNLVPVAKDELQGTISKPRFDSEFLDGSVYALHAFTRPSPTSMKAEILNWAPLNGVENRSNVIPRFDMMIDELMSWEDGGYQDTFNKQPVALQEKISELAARINEGEKDSRKAEDSFISGFLFSSTMIWRFMEAKSKKETNGDLNDAERL